MSRYLSERLSHLPQEVLGELDGLVHGEVQTAVADVLLDPAGKLPSLVCSGVSLWSTGIIPDPPALADPLMFAEHVSPCLQKSSARSRSSL